MSRLHSALIRPWATPRGLAGRLAGWEMSYGRGEFDDRVIAQLNVQPGEAILEVGCGPGVTVERLLARHTDLRITAVDPSPVMIKQAERRNREAVAAGRLRLAQAAAEALPFGTGEFDRGVTVNSIGHWTSSAKGLAELRRVLRPGGLLAVAARRPLPGERIGELREALHAAGFRLVHAAPIASGRLQGTILTATSD